MEGYPEYHKIQSIYKREPDGNRYLLEGEFSTPEFEYLQNCQWTYTEKIHGTNIRVIWDRVTQKVEFKGRTDKAQIPQHLLDKLLLLFPWGNFVTLYPEMSMCLYGEGFGLKIQSGGKYISDDCSFILFDVKIGHWWLKRDDVNKISDELMIMDVPLVGTGTLSEMVQIVKNGLPSFWGDFPAEGIVARPTVELKARSGERIITKIKHKDFPRGVNE